MFMKILRLYFPLCYRPVLYFSVILSALFLVFTLSFTKPSRVQRANLCSQISLFLREKGVVKNFLVASSQDTFSLLTPGAMAPEIFPARTATAV